MVLSELYDICLDLPSLRVTGWVQEADESALPKPHPSYPTPYLKITHRYNLNFGGLTLHFWARVQKYSQHFRVVNSEDDLEYQELVQKANGQMELPISELHKHNSRYIGMEKKKTTKSPYAVFFFYIICSSSSSLKVYRVRNFFLHLMSNY